MDLFVLLAYASLAASRTLFQQLLVCLNFTLDSYLLYRYKWKVISMNYGSSTGGLKNMKMSEIWPDSFDEGYIPTLIPTWTQSQNSLAAAETLTLRDILPWNISQIIRDYPNQHVNSHKYVVKRGIPFWVCWEANGNWDISIIRISQWRGSHCRMNTNIRRKKEIQKSRAVRVTVRHSGTKVNHLNKVIWDRKIIAEFTRSEKW